MVKPRPHIPTAKTLSQVRMGAPLGIPPHDIAKRLGIPKGQLLKPYAKGLATGPAQADKATRANLLIQVKNKGSGAIAPPKAWLHELTNSRPQRAESLPQQTEIAHTKSAIWRLAKERGELNNRSAPLDAFEVACRRIERAIMAMPTWTEEAVGN